MDKYIRLTIFTRPVQDRRYITLAEAARLLRPYIFDWQPDHSPETGNEGTCPICQSPATFESYAHKAKSRWECSSCGAASPWE